MWYNFRVALSETLGHILGAGSIVATVVAWLFDLRKRPKKGIIKWVALIIMIIVLGLLIINDYDIKHSQAESTPTPSDSVTVSEKPSETDSEHTSGFEQESVSPTTPPPTTLPPTTSPPTPTPTPTPKPTSTPTPTPTPTPEPVVESIWPEGLSYKEKVNQITAWINDEAGDAKARNGETYYGSDYAAVWDDDKLLKVRTNEDYFGASGEKLGKRYFEYYYHNGELYFLLISHQPTGQIATQDQTRIYFWNGESFRWYDSDKNEHASNHPKGAIYEQQSQDAYSAVWRLSGR